MGECTGAEIPGEGTKEEGIEDVFFVVAFVREGRAEYFDRREDSRFFRVARDRDDERRRE